MLTSFAVISLASSLHTSIARSQISRSICCDVGLRFLVSEANVCFERSCAEFWIVVISVSFTSSTHLSAGSRTYPMASLTRSFRPFSGDTRWGWYPSACLHICLT